MFKTQYNVDSHSYVTPAGSKVLAVYEFVTVDGSKQLIQTGESNIFERIQAATPSCEMENIIARYMSGDSSALLVRQGSYGDFTKMPKTYAELYDRMKDCELFFNRLPREIKAEYGNSMTRFWSEIDTPRTAGIVKKYVEKLDKRNADFIKSVSNVDNVVDMEVSNAE